MRSTENNFCNENCHNRSIPKVAFTRRRFTRCKMVVYLLKFFIVLKQPSLERILMS